ncbi:hypothetical protein BDF20DRAFT_892737 [Mycotypha africana]|uniref:uncharacterized protein n=1 Tax=Mycotypha africana TaxID=64632 RepID=UPI0023009076|nr:uncharacterized protein BDF20DRAFT_892737 [Mycotypha africana]KAI8968996.1 hypothetical protein BDF20DRAFT_892737 [Mycotypha africana]
MLASVPASTNTLSKSSPVSNTSTSHSCAARAVTSMPTENPSKGAFYQIPHDWPLNELQENIMTIATSSLIHTLHYQHSHPPPPAIVEAVEEEDDDDLSSPSSPLSYSSFEIDQSTYLNRRRSSTAVRCETCQRKFHSLGNLANHQQLYQHY